MMKILYCGLHYDYGKPERGLALEYKSMYDTLIHMEDVEVHFFGIDDEMSEHGRDGMNEKLIRTVDELKPDLVFFVLFTQELKKETVAAVTRKTKTFNWFGDDHWRVPVFSRHWAPLFTLVGTTDYQAVELYRSYGINNVIKTQWAADHFVYKPQPRNNGQEGYQITFLGQNYGIRGRYIEFLQNANLPAQGFGPGFPSGAINSIDQLLTIYSNSKINLNFTETQYVNFKERMKLLGKFFIKKEMGKIKPNFWSPFDNFRSAIGTQRHTIKARTFEVPACGGFLLTGHSDDPIDEYYTPGKEIIVFDSVDELIEKCRYYLSHEAERTAIAKAGFERTIREHTYEQRFKAIFKRIGL